MVRSEKWSSAINSQNWLSKLHVSYLVAAHAESVANLESSVELDSRSARKLCRSLVVADPPESSPRSSCTLSMKPRRS